jgi:hypothetical protein
VAIHAERGNERGDAAACQIVRAKEGAFRFSARPVVDVPKPTVEKTMDELIAVAGG